MIKSFKDKNLENCWRYDNCKSIKSALKKRVVNKLHYMDAATCLDDLRSPPSNRLHQLHDEYEGCWAISVNGPWRLIFMFQDGDIYNVQLEQYH
ncbi:hypothetical protein PN36_23075 [Candidatus Thiomargarita nelsonii]|uniref:Plasmid maintenance system killer protein n=1 Tax=Candidatus Thiomargarita nelsonii TaxID=1003181 RepID=A0A0A6P3Y9_9GAMM|nr:hypothetical protein PN36_23075 [Candidatus Thiomargarita nelsonii]